MSNVHKYTWDWLEGENDRRNQLEAERLTQLLVWAETARNRRSGTNGCNANVKQEKCVVVCCQVTSRHDALHHAVRFFVAVVAGFAHRNLVVHLLDSVTVYATCWSICLCMTFNGVCLQEFLNYFDIIVMADKCMQSYLSWKILSASGQLKQYVSTMTMLL
jgi:hypothetical protein